MNNIKQIKRTRLRLVVYILNICRVANLQSRYTNSDLPFLISLVIRRMLLI